MPDELYKFIGTRIADLRKKAELNQAQLADRLGVATNTVSRWETATYKPTADDLLQLARLFKISISSFFPEDPQPVSDKEPQTQALLSALGDLPPEDISELAQYAEFRRARRLMENANRTKRRT